MELFDVDPVRLARKMMGWPWPRAAVFLFILLGLRFIAAGLLPLSADEAYYWLWSRHLAAGYFDHPPLIAFVIRAGTILFGDTPFGVRLGGVLLSLGASWFVWRSGEILDPGNGLRACLIFNLTLMVTALGLAATPDAPSIAASAAFLYCLARLQQSRDRRWWWAVGAAAGIGLLAKYSAFFLGLGVAVWLLFAPKMRRDLWSPWPWLGAGLALAIFLPNLLWNEHHGWATFAFQFGRIGSGGFSPRFLPEFIAAQAGLATPLLFILGVFGFARATMQRSEDRFLLAALIWPALVYFTVHAAHDRVQGNWPCFLYPAFTILAAGPFAQVKHGALERVSRAAGLPLAAALVALLYVQAFFGILPLGRDPVSRLLGFGIERVAGQVEQIGAALHAKAVLAGDYETTGWLRFTLPSALPVVAVGQDGRYPDAPRAGPLSGPLLYVVEKSRDRPDFRAAHFVSPIRIAEIGRMRGGRRLATYFVYSVNGLRGSPAGRLP